MLRNYGYLIRVLHWCTDQNMTNALEKMDLTAAQGLVMGFLARCDAAPCSRDIEEHLNLSHPTVSGLLSRLEKKEFIELRTDENDRRCKRIYIRPKGDEHLDTMRLVMLVNEAQLIRGFSPEEQAQFTVFLERAIDNMGASLNHKEVSDR